MVSQVKMRVVFITLSLCSCMLFSNPADNYILLRTDAIGHFDFMLDKVNPYRQATFSVGAIKMNSITNEPLRSRLVDLDFIDNLDTSTVVSQFMYNRGDYGYRETDILVKNSVTESGTLLFNLHGRKNPIYYEVENSNSDYALQNFLIDYLIKFN